MSFKDRYSEELRYLRELGNEFVKDDPRLAPFLGDTSSDPDIARLMEGFAFLTTKLVMKIEDHFPEITHPVLQLVYPNYLRPLPSVTLIRFDPVDHALSSSQVIPKGTQLFSKPVDGVSCTFRTCTDVTLHPVVMRSASVTNSMDKSVITLELQTLSQQPLNQINCDQLSFHLGGDEASALTLYQWLAQHLKKIRVYINERAYNLAPSTLTFPGFEARDALLPNAAPHFEGYRPLQEYFYFPQRFHGFNLTGLRHLWPEGQAEQLRVELHFSRPMPESVQVTPETISLYCTPAINLFDHRAEPIQLNGREIREPVRPQGARPDAYEIFSIDQVSARHRDAEATEENPGQYFEPFESLLHRVELAKQPKARYYSIAIEQELLKPKAVHTLSLIHGDKRPYLGNREVLNVHLTCTNSNLPQQLDVGDINLINQTTPPFATYRNLTRPTRQYPAMFDGQTQWTLMSNLSLIRLSLSSPAALKAVLQVYDFIAPHDLQQHSNTQRRLNGIQHVSTKPIDHLVKGLPVRGSKTTLAVDPAAFSNAGDLHLFGSVLSHFMALYASEHAFEQLEIINTALHTRYTWPARTGQQPII